MKMPDSAIYRSTLVMGFRHLCCSEQVELASAAATKACCMVLRDTYM
jgi:hypothetical protein